LQHSPDTIRAALLLTNRLISLDARPLTAREFWDFTARHDPGDLFNRDASEIAELTHSSDDETARLLTLLRASTALAFEQDRLADGGIELVSALDERFPSSLRDRLGAACPTFLLVAGPIEWLDRPGLGIVGARDAPDAALLAARQSAEHAVAAGWPVISGLARGVDQAAMSGALDAGGVVVGVPAEGILRASRNAEIRGRVHGGELCIASPYAPGAPFTAGNAMGRNKIIYALSRVTFVVASDKDSGGTWAGAKEALDRHYAPVAVWAGDGGKDGNEALIERGAVPIIELDSLFAVQPRARSDSPVQQTFPI
jgi:predicted Rossmann fold nucleotide-binding protein DprA/Smf involved in DNA uptake